MTVILGIPTHIRSDLCHRCIASAFEGDVVPDLVYVIDNYGKFSSNDPRVRVVNPPENLGVARSWNLLHKLTRPHTLIIANDDIEFKPWAILAALERPEPMVLLSGWSCFLQKDEVWQSVGEYDETFWPGYFEDNDYAHRLRLRGFQEFHLPGNPVTHVGSATLKGLEPIHRETIHRCFDRSRDYYIRKWGGPPGEEKFTTAFEGQL